MAVCIYTRPVGLCDGSAPFERRGEHWFPRGFGNFRNFKELREKICADCNRRFGSELEAVLLRASPEALFRELAGGGFGRATHDKVDIFARGTNKHPPVKVTGEDPDARRELLWKVGPNSDAKPQRQIILIGPHREVEHVLLGSEVASFPEGLTALLRQKREMGYKPERFNGDSEEDLQLIDNLCTEVFGKKQVRFLTAEPGMTIQAQSFFQLTPTYFRAIAKIGFHSFLHFYPHLTGLEPQFDAIKRFIYLGDELNRYVFASRDVIVRAEDFEAPVHAIACDWSERSFDTHIQLFVGLESRMNVVAGTEAGNQISTRQGDLVWVVRLGPNPSTLVFEDRRGAVFRYSKQQQGGFHGDLFALKSGKALPIAALLSGHSRAPTNRRARWTLRTS
jgi:hypothetical protein